MKNKSYIIIFIILIFTFVLNTCDSISINVNESKNNGNLIIKALEKYYSDKGKYPFSLDSLTPHYLSEVPNVVNKKYFPFVKRKFKYQIWNHIPYKGCFIVSYDCKNDGNSYSYDSRTNKVGPGMTYVSYPERIDINIEHFQFEQIISSVNSYYKDSLKYPISIDKLVPNYLDSLPFDIKAQYRPRPDNPKTNSNIFEYRYFQPSNKFRGEYSLTFDASFGYYGYNDSEWYYDD